MMHNKNLLVIITSAVSLSVIGLLVYWLAIFFSKPLTMSSPAHQTPLSSLLQPSENATEDLPAPPAKEARILFGGDLMFDRTIRQRMDKQGVGFILSPLKETLTSYDLVVANLEGPVTSFPSRSVNSEVGSSNNFLFTFEPTIVPMLSEHNISIVNLGNNHITNFGTVGVEQTKSFLSDGNVAYFGNTGLEKSPEERILVTKVSDYNLAFVNMNQFIDDGFAEGLVDVEVANQKSDVDLVIVMTHWGNEYQASASAVIRQQAHQLVDAGADVIIGTHPHVIQNVEAYNGKVIYYSLGNFVFDQYFQPEVRKGWLVEMSIKNDLSLEFKEIPIQLQANGQTTLTH